MGIFQPITSTICMSVRFLLSSHSEYHCMLYPPSSPSSAGLPPDLSTPFTPPLPLHDDPSSIPSLSAPIQGMSNISPSKMNPTADEESEECDHVPNPGFNMLFDGAVLVPIDLSVYLQGRAPAAMPQNMV